MRKTTPYYRSDTSCIMVCAWCWPKDSWKLAFPELAACEDKEFCQVSHGMCRRCLETHTPTEVYNALEAQYNTIACSKPGCGYPDGKSCIGCGLVVEPPSPLFYK